MILIATEDRETDFEEIEAPPSPIKEIVTMVSSNFIIGIYNPKTMKFKGPVGDREVVVTIDPRATHNFLSSSIVAAAKISKN